MTAEEISERFDISIASAKIRAAEIARLNRRQSGQLRPLPPGIKDFLRNQQRRGFAVTHVNLDEN